MMDTIAFADSENAIICLNSFQHLGFESRWKLRNKNPLDA